MNATRLAGPPDRRPSHRVARRAEFAIRLLALTALVALGACVRQTSDFGRAAPGAAATAYRDQENRLFTPDEGAGEALAALGFRDPQSFAFTDEERQMQDRVWRFVVAPHARAWMFDRSVRPQRQKVALLMDETFAPEDYFAWLKAQNYRSSSVRFATVADHIEADIATAPATVEAICAVDTLTERRRIAIVEIDPADPAIAVALADREARNQDFIDWFVRALTTREAAYKLALDRLLIETPDVAAREVNDALNRLAPFTERARRGEFCPRPEIELGADPTMGFGGGRAPVPGGAGGPDF